MTSRPLWIDSSDWLEQALPSRQLLTRLAKVLNGLPPTVYTLGVQILLDALTCACALLFSYLLRFEFAIPSKEWRQLVFWLIVLPVARPACLLLCGTYTRIWRYFNLDDALVFTTASMIPSVIALLVHLWLARNASYDAIPLSIIIIEFGVFVTMSVNVRLLRRMTFSVSEARTQQYLRVLLIGSANSLSHAAQRLRTCGEVLVEGMLVSEGILKGLRIGGFPVLGDVRMLFNILSSRLIDLVLITDPSIESMAEVIQTSAELGIEVKILPDTANVIYGDVRLATRPKPEVALGRRVAVTAPHPLVVEAFRDRVVLITGAGGSIGSELSRQVAELPVKSLVLMDQDENSIFEICNELASKSKVKLFPIVGDICDRVRLQRLFAEQAPKIVLHAAAYKHVPVMEENRCEAVRNNVIGTKEVAEAAMQYNAERFLLISTDKAVRPTSIMGATKRVAELTIQLLAAHGHSTRSACVRFGNVLGSRGSVVPIFLRQIASGGPVTITDDNMTRYFMTIPDAVRLVLQAATLGSNGDIFMLDMGDPVKITNLARRLIEASGLRPGTDIEIRRTGMRPGEKLHEQLWSEDATVRSTIFPEVFRVLADQPSRAFETQLKELIETANSHDDGEVLATLRRMPIDFQSSPYGKVAIA